MQHNANPCEHAGMFYLDGSTKVSEGSTVLLCVDGCVKVDVPQHEETE
jgi:hypothetical protein